MKTKKIFALLLTICMLLSTVGLFTAYAEDTLLEEKYAALYAEKEEYLKEHTEYNSIYYEESMLTILLYTDTAKDWNYERISFDAVYGGYEGEQFGVSILKMFFGAGFFIKCSEIVELSKNCNYMRWYDGAYHDRDGSLLKGTSLLRECIKHFDISKEELISANKKMQEDPYSVFELFPMLSDHDIVSFSVDNIKKRVLPEFIIEALYLEDDRAANTLLFADTTTLYMEDGCIVRAVNLSGDDYYNMTVEELAEYDLKPIWVEYFLNNTEVAEIIGEEKLALLKAEREYQLENPNVQKNGPEFSFNVNYFYNKTISLECYDLTVPDVEEFLNDPRVIAKFGEKNIAELKAEREKQLKKTLNR